MLDFDNFLKSEVQKSLSKIKKFFIFLTENINFLLYKLWNSIYDSKTYNYNEKWVRLLKNLSFPSSFKYNPLKIQKFGINKNEINEKLGQ